MGTMKLINVALLASAVLSASIDKVCTDIEAQHNYLRKRVPKYGSCFANSLSFEKVDHVCSPECKKLLPKAAREIREKCPKLHLGKQEIFQTKMISVLQWGDKGGACLMCKKMEGSDTRCIQALFDAHVSLLNTKSTANHCNPCTTELARRYAHRPFAIPTLYTHRISDPDVLLDRIVKDCL
ncbi:hypothetical protein DSO57_1033109 [Entomophthora muscae]|uniref:Uncharacterized protein n=1 Tax=Entomophthora muscae TaxID=34485 RepID=A0ACC2TZ93_9FUNG|nr:hypothetical protein DSO57_1033109 [Entomophthora muscae]